MTSTSTSTERVGALLALEHSAVSLAAKGSSRVNTHAARVDFGRRPGGDAETTETCVLVSSSVSPMSLRLRLLESR